MNGVEFDIFQSDFLAVLKDWQFKAMQVIWSSSEGANSRAVWEKVNQMLGGETISRASVINFIEDMREMGSSAEFRGQERAATPSRSSGRPGGRYTEAGTLMRRSWSTSSSL
jgi:hypothetical protein